MPGQNNKSNLNSGTSSNKGGLDFAKKDKPFLFTPAKNFSPKDKLKKNQKGVFSQDLNHKEIFLGLYKEIDVLKKSLHSLGSLMNARQKLASSDPMKTTGFYGKNSSKLMNSVNADSNNVVGKNSQKVNNLNESTELKSELKKNNSSKPMSNTNSSNLLNLKNKKSEKDNKKSYSHNL